MTEFESGELTVYFGPMYSGKTTALIDDMHRCEIAGLRSVLFKPKIDDRGEGVEVVRSRLNLCREAVPVSIENPAEILAKLPKNVDVVGIDEVQFMSTEIVAVISDLIKGGKIRVSVAGLPTDFRGEPFGAMPILMAKADRLVQSTAVCTFRENGSRRTCVIPATRTQRLINGQPASWDSPIIQVGNTELYEARCRRHHIVPGKPIK
jgi:thymidine kinase